MSRCRRFPSRAFVARGLAASWLVVAGCARDPEPPDAGGAPCDADVQCAVRDAGVACGALAACVAGRCARVDVDAGASGFDLDCVLADAATPP